MRKFFYFIYVMSFLGMVCGVASCDNEPKNPGDFSIKSQLTIGNVVSMTTGETYPLNIAMTMDSVFGTNVTVWDTVYDAQGNYQDRSSRNVWVPSTFTTSYIEYEPITVPALPDTFSLQIYTNARWVSPAMVKPRGGSQFYNDATTSGGGDGTLIFRSEINENKTRTVAASLNIYTSDSTVYHSVRLLQEGLAD